MEKMMRSLADHPEYGQLTRFQQAGAELALKVIARTIEAKALEPSNITRVCDFGAGIGGGTFALKQVFNLPPGALIALEQQPEEKVYLRRVLPEKDAFCGDGLDYLSRGRHAFDLITAFMLGPDLEGGLIRQFFAAASKSLAANGVILACSDTDTMAVARALCDYYGLGYTWLSSNNQADDDGPDTLLLSPGSFANAGSEFFKLA